MFRRQMTESRGAEIPPHSLKAMEGQKNHHRKRATRVVKLKSASMMKEREAESHKTRAGATSNLPYVCI